MKKDNKVENNNQLVMLMLNMNKVISTLNIMLELVNFSSNELDLIFSEGEIIELNKEVSNIIKVCTDKHVLLFSKIGDKNV